MANDSGPWGRPKPGSSGGGGKRPPPPGNDFDDMFRKGQDQFKHMFNKGGDEPDQKKGIILAVVAIFVLWLASGIYRVGADEQGVVLRFGQYTNSTGPGLHYHLPAPFETVYTPSVTSINKVEIRGDQFSRNEDNRMLAGDLNLVDINFDVQWKIDPNRTADFLFNIRQPVETIRPVAESVMREVIGQMPLAYIIDKGQAEIAERSTKSIQDVLNQYKAGITIVGVNLRKPDVPDEVIDSYQDVKKAEQDLETEVSKANRYKNQIIPVAKGKAAQMEQRALAYKAETVAEAKGQASRFLSVYNEYKVAKDVTRKRMYLESMEKIMADMPKVIIDKKASGGVLPYLPLPEVQNNRLKKAGN
ncbi:MAG: FtsH protease activity modulator HflK [Rickettsiales bacterium]|nr:FtsH protease activity modulator HflK [Rickettsiales bacterium]